MWKCCTSTWRVCFMLLWVLYGEVIVVDSQLECYEDTAQVACPNSDEYTYIAEALFTYFQNHNEITFPVCTSAGTPWGSQNNCTSTGTEQFVEESCDGSKSCDTYVNYEINDTSSILGVYRINYFCCEPVTNKILSSPVCDWSGNKATPATFNYQFFPTEVNMAGIHFRAKASQYVYIGLSITGSEQPDMYEVVIGGWSNEYSVIRRCPATSCPHFLEKVYTKDILSTTEYRGFWITYDYATGRLVVGQDGQGSFMSWTDPSPLDVRYMGYSTGSYSTGEFQFCNYTNDCSPDPCLNGATCVDGVDSFTCTCAAGYMGTNCETDIDDCDPDQYLNGATCADGVNSFRHYFCLILAVIFMIS